MILDFSKIDTTVLHHFNGGEKDTVAKMFLNDDHRIMYASLEPGASIGLHTHNDADEVIFILEGQGKVLFDDTEERVLRGQSHYCMKGHTHSLINDGDMPLVFFAVVTYY